MSIFINPNLHVRIEEMSGESAPRPLPLQSGFSKDKTYEVLGIHTPSESAEAFLILRNDRDELWFISNRHCRIVDKLPTIHRNGKVKVGAK
ncbi:MAG: hypothetical protein H7Y17_10900 [Chlorobia bacterium]|nr:hypothetical protein [Fimbriimonadaceae bacterium]